MNNVWQGKAAQPDLDHKCHQFKEEKVIMDPGVVRERSMKTTVIESGFIAFQ